MVILLYAGWSYGFAGGSPQFYYIIGLLAVAVLGLFAQSRVQSTFKRYSQMQANNGLTAAQVAENLLRNNNSNVTVRQVSGSLTDNYNSRTGIVSLSQTVYSSYSVAAMAVAAHEVGHVMQYENDYAPIKFRNTLLPIASFGANFSYLIVLAGLFMGSMGYMVSLIGVAIFAFTFIFQLVTLPVELNASSRALDMLTAGGYITGAEQENAARKVLRAAALTYIVAALSSLLSLLRLLSIANSRRR